MFQFFQTFEVHSDSLEIGKWNKVCQNITLLLFFKSFVDFLDEDRVP